MNYNTALDISTIKLMLNYCHKFNITDNLCSLACSVSRNDTVQEVRSRPSSKQVLQLAMHSILARDI